MPAVERTELERPREITQTTMASNNPPPTPPPTLIASTVDHQIGQQTTTPLNTGVGGNAVHQNIITCPRPSPRPAPQIIVAATNQRANTTRFPPPMSTNVTNNTNNKEQTSTSTFPLQTNTRKLTSILSLSLKKNVNANRVTPSNSTVIPQPSTSTSLQPKIYFLPQPSTSNANPPATYTDAPISIHGNMPSTQQNKKVITLDHSVEEPAGSLQMISQEEDDRLLNLNDKIAKLQDEIKKVEKQKEEKLQREREEAKKKKQQQEEEIKRKKEEERRKAQDEKKRRENTRQTTQENMLSGKYSTF